MQVSPSGSFVATFFMKTVFVYSTERPALPPLKLYHTREITVGLLFPLLTSVAVVLVCCKPMRMWPARLCWNSAGTLLFRLECTQHLSTAGLGCQNPVVVICVTACCLDHSFWFTECNADVVRVSCIASVTIAGVVTKTWKVCMLS